MRWPVVEAMEAKFSVSYENNCLIELSGFPMFMNTVLYQATEWHVCDPENLTY